MLQLLLLRGRRAPAGTLRGRRPCWPGAGRQSACAALPRARGVVCTEGERRPQGMATRYEFAEAEQRVYAWWERAGLFSPPAAKLGAEGGEKEAPPPFVMHMPPPNVTGHLHMGHALFVALQDCLVRFHRMRGRPTLWLPGTDHAGIATQLQVENHLFGGDGHGEGDGGGGGGRKERREAMGRREFERHVWQWKEDKGGYILRQLRRLGASADWSRERFTLDEGTMSSAVYRAFEELHQRGLIYRGDYMVNWSPALQTAVSDLEVEYVEEDAPMYHFRYYLCNNSVSGDAESISVATTRPETVLGDMAVCVHPEDARYRPFHDKHVVVPFVDREIPVITDERVDPTFGTGAVKITPGHDPFDYQLGLDHDLGPFLSVLTVDGRINENGGPYAGLDRAACRKRIWSDMQHAGMAIKVEEHRARVPRAQRGGEVIEPMVSKQWFVRVDSMAARAVQAVRSGKLDIVPRRFEKQWYHWLEDAHDWCISRQLWWGHRIPVWYINGSPADYVVAPDEPAARRAAIEALTARGIDDPAAAITSLTQDPDVLDTWFSSALWPFATLGWGWSSAKLDEDTLGDLARFYPSTVLETGYDILFFWVARMVMMGLELTDKLPFSTVYLHGLVRDADKQKMSKSKGNVIDPLVMSDKYGADALRLALITGNTPGADIALAEDKIRSFRNFATKLWNIGRYIEHHCAALSTPAEDSLSALRWDWHAQWFALRLPERFILAKCLQTVQTVTSALEAFQFTQASETLYSFLWDDFADWYVEISKARDKKGDDGRHANLVLQHVYGVALQLLHPLAPFVTEALWHVRGYATGAPAVSLCDLDTNAAQLHARDCALMCAAWPTAPALDSNDRLAHDLSVAHFDVLRSIVRSVRAVKDEFGVPSAADLEGVTVAIADPELRAEMEQERALLARLGRMDAQSLTVADEHSRGEGVHQVLEQGIEMYVPLREHLDIEQELVRSSRSIQDEEKRVQQIRKVLSSEDFLSKAPTHVVQQQHERLDEAERSLAALRRRQEQLRAMT